VIELKTADEIDKMAVTGEFVADTLATLSIEAQPGVNVMQLEHHAVRNHATGITRRHSVAVHSEMSYACQSTTLCYTEFHATMC
jgi:methionine aminopeptidase